MAAAAMALSSGGCVPIGAAELVPLHHGDREHHQRDGELPITSDVNDAKTGGFVNDNAIVT